jgi:hypothetical protein
MPAGPANRMICRVIWRDPQGPAKTLKFSKGKSDKKSVQKHLRKG